MEATFHKAGDTALKVRGFPARHNTFVGLHSLIG